MDKVKALTVSLAFGLIVVTGLWGLDWGFRAGDAEPTVEPVAAGTELSADASPLEVEPTVGRADSAAEEDERAVVDRFRPIQRRRISMWFGCEALGRTMMAAWRHVNLRVRILDETEAPVAECLRPDMPFAASIPPGVEQITVVAPGYERKRVTIPKTPGTKSTAVILRPDAVVRLRALNLAAALGDRFACRVVFATGVSDSGELILGARGSYRQPDEVAASGTAVWEFRVPSGIPASFEVVRTGRSPGDRSGWLRLDSTVVTLSSGEDREIVLDPLDYGVLEGRVVGLAERALEDQVVVMRVVSGRNARGAGSEAGPIRLDAGGRFRIVGLSEERVALTLSTQGAESVPLREIDSHRRQWSRRDARFLVLEPEVPVYGVVPVQSGRELFRPFRVQVSSISGHFDLSRTIPLFTRQRLEQSPLSFYVESVGHFQRSLRGVPPDGDGLYRIEVPKPGGDLLVRVEGQPEKGLGVSARPVHGAVGVAGTHDGNRWQFKGLAEGEYRLLLSYDGANDRGRDVHSSRILGETVVVQAGREVEVAVQMPDLLDIPGRVIYGPGVEAPLVPEWVQLQHGGRSHRVPIGSKGEFQFTVMGPWRGVSRVLFSGRGLLADVPTDDVAWIPEQRRLIATLPSVRKRWLVARPVAGGRLWADLYPRRDGSRQGCQLRATKGRFLIQDVPGGVDGILWERVRRGSRVRRIVRGWFRLDAGGSEETRLECEGRFVRVRMAKTDQSATLTLKPPLWWRHPSSSLPQMKIRGTSAQRLWLPADCAAVVIRGKQEVSSQRIGDELVLR